MTTEKYNPIILPTIDLILDRGTYTFRKQNITKGDNPTLIYIPANYMDILQKRSFAKILGYTPQVEETWQRNTRMILNYVLDHELRKDKDVPIGDNMYVRVSTQPKNQNSPIQIIRQLLKEYKNQLLVQASNLETKNVLQLEGIPFTSPSYIDLYEHWSDRAVIALRAHDQDLITSVRKEETIVETPSTKKEYDIIPAQHVEQILKLDYSPMYNQFLIIENADKKNDIYRARTLPSIDIPTEDQQKYFVKTDLSDIGTRIRKIWNRNELKINQQMALDLLFDDHIKIVFLLGPSLAGKTTLAMASAEAQTLHSAIHNPKPNQILFMRSMPNYHGEGLEDLLHEYASFKRTFSEQNIVAPFEEMLKPIGLREKAYERSVPYIGDGNPPVGLALPAKAPFVLIPPGNFSGISFNQGFVIHDEAQNEQPYVLEEALGRIGEHGKFIIMGSLEQVTRPGFDQKWNGLIVAIANEIGKPYVGVMPLVDSFRYAPTPR